MTCTYTIWSLMLVAAAIGVDASESTAVTSNARVRDSHPVSLIRVSPTTEEFQQRVAAGVQSIPTHVWQGLASAGWQICTAEFVVDAVPSLKGVHPRGWPLGMTWENTDAVHMPKRRILVIAEKLYNRQGEPFASPRVIGTLRHEVGHAFDMAALGTTEYLSSTPEFIAVYDRDWADLDSSRRDSLAYYAQSKIAGRQEAFAEAFAASLGGGSEYVKHKAFTAAFPAVMTFVESAIRDYAPSTQKMQASPPPLMDQADDATAAQPFIGDPPTAISLEYANPSATTDHSDRTPQRADIQGQSRSTADEQAAAAQTTNDSHEHVLPPRPWFRRRR